MRAKSQTGDCCSQWQSGLQGPDTVQEYLDVFLRRHTCHETASHLNIQFGATIADV